MATLPAGQSLQAAKNSKAFTEIPGFVAVANKVYRIEGGSPQVWDGSAFSDFTAIEAGRSYQVVMNSGGTFDDWGAPAGGTVSVEKLTATQGQTNFTTNGTLPTGANFIVIRNSYLLSDPDFLPTRTGAKTFTIPNAADAGDIITVPTIQ